MRIFLLLCVIVCCSDNVYGMEKGIEDDVQRLLYYVRVSSPKNALEKILNTSEDVKEYINNKKQVCNPSKYILDYCNRRENLADFIATKGWFKQCSEAFQDYTSKKDGSDTKLANALYHVYNTRSEAKKDRLSHVAYYFAQLSSAEQKALLKTLFGTLSNERINEILEEMPINEMMLLPGRLRGEEVICERYGEKWYVKDNIFTSHLTLKEIRRLAFYFNFINNSHLINDYMKNFNKNGAIEYETLSRHIVNSSGMTLNEFMKNESVTIKYSKPLSTSLFSDLFLDYFRRYLYVSVPSGVMASLLFILSKDRSMTVLRDLYMGASFLVYLTAFVFEALREAAPICSLSFCGLLCALDKLTTFERYFGMQLVLHFFGSIIASKLYAAAEPKTELVTFAELPRLLKEDEEGKITLL